MAESKKPNKIKEFGKITEAEERLQFLYKEIFALTDKVTEVYNQQQDIGQLLVNLAKELSQLKAIDINKHLK